MFRCWMIKSPPSLHKKCISLISEPFKLPGWNSVSVGTTPFVNNYHSLPGGASWSLQIFIGATPKLFCSGHVDTLGGTMDEACWEKVEGKVWKIMEDP